MSQDSTAVLKAAIQPKKVEYELDSSDEEELRNTIGNVPLNWYDEYDHIGYDLEGKKIMKPKGNAKDALDQFMDKMEDPNYWRTVMDQQTGQPIVLTDEDIELIKRLTSAKYANADIDEFETSNFFTKDVMEMPISGRPEHKRSFVPSNWERLRVGRYVHAIKMGWIKPQKPKEDTTQPKFYDIWGQDPSADSMKRYLHHLPAPKLPLPDHNESYNPPPEYLLDEKELAKWNDQEPEERRINFVPQKYNSLRLVPAYDQFIKEKFNRCLDMYLCPRQRKMKAQVNPEDLIPKLPKPKDLQPFPNQLSIVFKGHKNIVRSISVHASGEWLVSGCDDKCIKFWEVSTGRCLSTIKFNEKVIHVEWIPVVTLHLVAIIAGKSLSLVNPKLGDKLTVSHTDNLMKDYHASAVNLSADLIEKAPCKWNFFAEQANDESYKQGWRVELSHEKTLKNCAWHPKGDYFATVIDDKADTNSVIMHQMSKQKSVRPFAKMSGIVQQVTFHPHKPILFIATQRYVKVYDLVKQSLVKKLLTNSRWVSSIDIHSGGDNLIIGSYDSRMTWFDLDLSAKPYKTLKHHKKAIRDVCYHKKYPLFASASDDGTAIVCHGMVYK